MVVDDAADDGDRQLARREAREQLGGAGERGLEVFAAAEREVARPLLAEQLDSRGVERQRLEVDLDAGLGALGDVAEVLEQAVGDVDRAGDTRLDRGTAERDAGDRASMRGKQGRRGGLRLTARLDQGEASGGCARRAGDGNRVADGRGVATEGRSRGRPRTPRRRAW